MKPIVTLTINPSIDISSTAEEVIPTRKIRCSSPRYDPGGGGINVAKAVHILGGQAMAIYTSGGPTGNILDALMMEQGFDHLRIPIAGWTRESFAIGEIKSSNQYRFNMPGPVLDQTEVESFFSALSKLAISPEYLVVSGSIEPGVMNTFFTQLNSLAASKGMKLVVDTSGPRLRESVEAGAYLIKPNRQELAELVASELSSDTDLEEAAKSLIEKAYVQVVVVSLGAEGALLVTKETKKWFKAPKVEPESQIGAGDSMLGAILFKLAQGGSAVEAVRLGVAAGTAAVLTAGTELFHLSEVEKILPDIH